MVSFEISEAISDLYNVGLLISYVEIELDIDAT